jgi:uncharacterized protein involved in exopolysaccharide biosynthesis
MDIQELLIYWRVVKKRLWLIGLMVAATLGAMLLAFNLSKPVYRATIAFQVTAPLPAEVSLFSDFKMPYTRDEIVRTRSGFMTVLQSEFLAGQIIEELGIDMGADELLSQMVMEPGEGNDFDKLRITAHDPELAAAVANALLDKALLHFGEMSAGSLTANREFIQQQLVEIKADLDTARADLIQFQVENRIGSLSGFLDSQESLVTTLKSRHDQALAEGREATAASFEEIIATRERELQELVLLSAEYEVLKDTVHRIESTYANLLGKETEAIIKEDQVRSAKFVQVIPAGVPSRPLPRLDVKVMLLGGIVSLALGIMLAFALEFLGRTVVEDSVDAPTPLPQTLGS